MRRPNVRCKQGGLQVPISIRRFVDEIARPQVLTRKSWMGAVGEAVGHCESVDAWRGALRRKDAPAGLVKVIEIAQVFW